MKVIRNTIMLNNFKNFYDNSRSMQLFKALKAKDIFKENIATQNLTNVEVAVEESITAVINGRYRINLICTPLMIEDLLVGYLISEGICKNANNIKEITYLDENVFTIEIEQEIEDIKNLMEIRSSGCVGIKQQYMDLDLNKKICSNLKLNPTTIFKAQRTLREKGEIWQKSGGTHMSGLFNQKGDLIVYAEDVGRHNTFDKIIGYAVIHNFDLNQAFVCTSGRLSAAMVSKIGRAGIPILVSVSAPMAQGIELAEKIGLTLIGFSRTPALNIYTYYERIRIS
ncbi:MAG: formate dehydrogenase accessory sulfurtransferase FdhD [Promethearchaeota archaeon]